MAIPPVQLFSQQPGGGIVTAGRGINALRQSDLENKIKSIEAQYAPYNKYADAASKLAYSQFVGPQAIATILSNPASRGMFTPEQYNQLTNAFASQVKNPGITLGNLPIPQQEVSPFRQLMNYITGNRSPLQTPNPIAPQQLQQLQQMQQQGAPQNMTNQIPYGPDQSSFMPNQMPTQIDNNRGFGGTSPTIQRELKNIPPGTYGPTSPPAITQAGEAGLKTQSEAEARAITDQWQKREDDIRDQSTGSIEMENQLERLSQLRGELSPYEKGFPLGYLPAVSNAAQESALVENNLIAARLKAWQSNRITNMDIGFGKGMKPGRWMNDQSFYNEKNYELALAKRLQENSAFLNAARNKGLSPTQADSIWIRYANEKPFFNPKTKQPIDENFDTWEQYLTPDNIRQTFSPSYRKQMSQYKNNMAGANPQKDKNIMNQYASPQGKSRGAQILSHQMQLPKFNNKEEFLNWYNQQDQFVRHAVRMKLGEK